MHDYKNSLLMPVTKFEMKANLATKEPKIQAQWVYDQIEKKILQKNKKNKPFIIADGPPYANGKIHIGHALNKILKDFILRYKNMCGFYTKYIPGWDTHGLPIEHALLQTGVNNDPKLTISQKRKNCQDFALKHVYLQKEEFLRLGLYSEMEEIYLTCDLNYVVDQLKILYKLIQKKLIYQAFKPVYWSWSSKTALADGEIIYQESTSESLYVRLPVISSNCSFVQKKDYLLIWTTTPYTLPANLAVCVHPKITYARIQVDNKDYYIVAHSLVNQLQTVLGWKDVQIIATFPGKQLEHTQYEFLLTKKKPKVLVDTYVSESDGTGLVHNAPGFGPEDYFVCKRYGIKPYCPIDEDGKFTAPVTPNHLVGQFYTKANAAIIADLKATNHLVLHTQLVHQTAHDWRTKKPVIYRATKQWFVNIEKILPNITSALKKVKSVDPSLVVKIKEMVLNRKEWCISRQRIWGVPITVLYDKDLVPILDKNLLQNILKIIDNEGVNSWYNNSAEYFLPPTYSKKKKYLKEVDIMDVWFDSGTSYSVLQKEKLSFPADLYLEGKDQFRGWFNSSLITAVAAFDTAPYKSLLTHGFVLDEKGNKMSKSLGNVVDPMHICNQFGADVLRIWVANSDYKNDVAASNNIINQCSEIYRRIRNTLFRFMLGNLHNYTFPVKNQYSAADCYVLTQHELDLKQIKQAYEQYDFKQVMRIVLNRVNELSAWYFEYIKDSLYCDGPLAPKRLAIQKVLYTLLSNFIKVLAPIIPHTCEEAYAYLPSKLAKQKSVHLESFPTKPILKAEQKADLKVWEAFFACKDVVYNAIEQARQSGVITHKNNAIVTVVSNQKAMFDLSLLADYLQVVKVKWTVAKNKTNHTTYTASVTNANYVKCVRCWRYYAPSTVKKGVCVRCKTVLNSN